MGTAISRLTGTQPQENDRVYDLLLQILQDIRNGAYLDAFTQLYQPPINFICLTDMQRRAYPTPPRSIHLVLRLPRVPFIFNQRFDRSGPTSSVVFGVVHLDLCENYDQFIFQLRVAFITSVVELPDVENDDPIPGYQIWYELMGPVRRRCVLYTHPWNVFKARVRLIVIEKRLVPEPI